MQKLNFNTQDTRRLPLREAPDKFKSSDIRQGVFEVSAGERPHLAAYAYKYLPVMFKDISTEDYVAINKGKIVSLITNQNAAGTPSGAIPNPSASGTIHVYDDATATSTSIQTVNIDDHFFGYGDTIAGLLVPCNSYSATNHTYTQLDVDAGTIKTDGTYAAVGDVQAVPANIPVGVLTMDAYQDIRGKYINYQMWDVTGILCDFYIEVPYVDETTTLGATLSVGTTPSDAVYNAIFREHAFFRIASGQSALAGCTIKSDAYGEYAIENAANGNRTTLTVGKLILTDSRWPKGMLDVVDTYPGSYTSGTETAGLPAHLYKFVYATLTAAGASNGRQDCLAAVQDGTFGTARIQLEI